MDDGNLLPDALRSVIRALRSVLRKSFQRFFCGFLLRFLLALACSVTGQLSLEPHFHFELFLVVGAGLGGDPVFGELLEPLLAELLELGFIIE